MRRAARIDRGHREIVAALRAVGVGVTSLAAAGSGIPDLLCSYRGTWFLLEVKSPIGPNGGKSADGQHLGELQRQWASAHRAPVHVVRGIDDALRVIGAARGARMPEEARIHLVVDRASD